MRKVVNARSPKAAAILGNDCTQIQPGSHNTPLKKSSFNGITLSFLLFVLRCFGNIVYRPNQILVGFLADVSEVPVWQSLAEKCSLISCWSTKTSLVSATARCLLTLFFCAVHYADYLKRENKPMRIVSIRWQIIRTNDDFQTSRTTLCRCVVVQICPLFDLHGVMTFLSPDKRHFATGWSGQKEIDQVLSRGTAPTQCAQSKALYSK